MKSDQIDSAVIQYMRCTKELVSYMRDFLEILKADPDNEYLREVYECLMKSLMDVPTPTPIDLEKEYRREKDKA